MIQKDIFFSYSRKDKERIKPIVRALESQGWSVWWDIQIPPGETFDDVIEDALEHACCVIVAWSEHSVISNWVRNEASEGNDRRVLVPILLDKVKIPLAFRRIQAANLVQWGGDIGNEEFQKLIAKISGIVGDKKSSTRNDQALPKGIPSTENVADHIRGSISHPVDAGAGASPGIVVDSGALNAMIKGASLYPVGILGTIGNFPLGARIALYDQNNVLIAEGISQYTSNEIRKIMGKQSNQIPQFLGNYRGDVVVPINSVSWKMGKTRSTNIPKAGILVDLGAIRAMRTGSNLLPIGVLNVIGYFDAGATIDIFDTNQKLVAQAVSEYSSGEIKKIMGKHSNTIRSSLGIYRGDVIVQNNSIIWK